LRILSAVALGWLLIMFAPNAGVVSSSLAIFGDKELLDLPFDNFCCSVQPNKKFSILWSNAVFYVRSWRVGLLIFAAMVAK
jgi:hypothetical protein